MTEPRAAKEIAHQISFDGCQIHAYGDDIFIIHVRSLGPAKLVTVLAADYANNPNPLWWIENAKPPTR